MPDNHEVEKAQLTIEAVSRLKETAAFTEYFIPRLKARQAALGERILRDASLSPEAREIERRVFVEYDEILKLLDQDQALARRVILLQRE